MRLIDQLRRSVEDRAGYVQLLETWRADSTQAPQSDWSRHTSHFATNAAVFSVMNARASLFQEVRFAYRDRTTGELVDGPLLLRNPRRLLARMIQDLDLAGNAFIYKPTQTDWQRLPPTKVEVLTQDGQVVQYAYWPDGIGNGTSRPMGLNEVAHWYFYPDPSDPYTGVSWLMAVNSELSNDALMARHKTAFFRNAATPNIILSVKGTLPDQKRKDTLDQLSRRHEGAGNAYRTMLLEGGAEAHVVGNTFEAMDFARLVDAGETRIASAGGVPPVLVGFNSGLQAATYSNYLHAMRRFADATLRPLWGSAAEALKPIVPIRTGMELVYDDRRVPALQQDALDDAEIQNRKAQTISTLITAGYDPDQVVGAVMNNDLESLTHTGALPTSLYNPNTQPAPTDAVQSEEDDAVSDE